MRSLDEFIDKQIFLNSKEGESINSLILELLEQTAAEKEESAKEEYANAGNASEFTTYIAIYNKFKKLASDNKFILTNNIPIEKAQEKAKKLTLNIKNQSNSLERLESESEEFSKKIIDSTFIKNEYINPPNLKLETLTINYSGVDLSGKSSADLELIFKYNEDVDVRIFRISLKRNNNRIYGASRTKKQKITKRFANKIPSPEEIDSILIKSEGGGSNKLFKIFGFTPSREILSQINKNSDSLNVLIRQGFNPKKYNLEENSKKYEELINLRRKLITDSFKEFYIFLNKELTGDKSLDRTSKLFNIFFNLMTRSDDNVVLFADIGVNQTFFLIPIIKKYLGHIKSVEVSYSNVIEDDKSKNPTIKFIVPQTSITNFTNTLTSKEKTINKNLYSELYNLSKKINSLESRLKSPEEQSGYLRDISKVFEIFGIPKKQIDSNDEKQISNLYADIVNNANSYLNSLETTLFQLSYKFYTSVSYMDKINPVKEKRVKSDDAIFAVGSKSFKRFSDNMNNLYELEKNPSGDIKQFLSLMEKILLSSMPSLETPMVQTESLEYLIKEALDEKEHQKVMKKVMASGAKGLISAIPSNKTNNSIAVRFDSEDTIDAGIKKVKSSLRSAGYQLDDKRVLKFDQNRDTTDVIKNGEVVGRLFYRVDVKERKGLAYEHILGAVLTGLITDQLKNRIDLGPDASKEDVMSKLNSEELKPLFDSAKKAAPLINKKVGKVVKAESVGSTNNKADFVLTTQDGKTVGLSAKYAAGEKDNEYKMNKVLGFGTEEDSLVYNPKMVPWWVVGRKLFLEKLKKNTGAFSGREYDPDYEDLDAPAWMKTAKESNPDVYKETMEELYGHIRNILTKNLRRMKIRDLTAFVMEADLGKEEERENYDSFIKVVDGPSGLSVTDINIDHEDTTNMGKLDPEQIVVQDRSDIIIKLPGFDELKINSIKFKSDMLSSKAGDLKIKTR